jgi:uncharacterized pyridoxamine 5'-phosphate oxidase family protein
MDKIMRLLKENRVMNLATSYGDKPRSSIMEYIMVGDAMVFSTDPESIKGKNLAKNPKVSLTVGGMPVFLTMDGTVTYAGPVEAEEYNRELVRRYPEFAEMMASGAMKFRHFRVVFDTAYYSEGMGPAEIISMGK